MNKKFLIFGVVGLIAIGLVAAISYYALFSASFNVLPPITTEGNLKQTFGDVFGGETITGSPITITNNAPLERAIVLSDDSGSDVDVSYIGKLVLTEKVVDFSKDVWEIPSDPNTAVIEYTIVGNEFSAEVSSPIEGYVLIYYKDNSDRFNSPAKAILVNDVVGNLAYEDDANNDEYDYCSTGEYLTCHGAKIWYVPSDAVNGDGNIVWSRASDFYFETELIQYNSNGKLVIYSGQTLTIIPEYTPSSYVSGEYTITTTVA